MIACILQPYNIGVAHKFTTTTYQRQGQRQTKGKTESSHTRSNAATDRLLTLVKPAETLTRD